MPDDLRTRIAEALDEASRTHPCTCGSTIWSSCFHDDAPTHSERRSDAVLAVVQPELDRRDRYQEHLRGMRTWYRDSWRAAARERDRYRAAWQSARLRAEAHSEGSQRHIEARDAWKGWMHEQAQRAANAEAALARVRDYCTLLADASCRVAARETAMDVLRLFDGDAPSAPPEPPPGDTEQALRRVRELDAAGQPLSYRRRPRPDSGWTWNRNGVQRNGGGGEQ